MRLSGSHESGSGGRVPLFAGGGGMLAAIVALLVGTLVSAPSRSLEAPPGCALISVAAENARAGGTGWRPDPHLVVPGVQGYADLTSADCGQRVTLRLGALGTGPVPVRIQAWRLGYYQGRGGRLVWTSRIIMVGHPTTWSTLTSSTHMLRAPWAAATALTIPHDWPQGVYVLRIAPVHRPWDGAEIPLVVRDPGRLTTYVHVLAVNTWEMYNAWGGWSAYTTPRSRLVSFDRPFPGSGVGQLLLDEYPLVRFAERLGLDISYATDIDLDRGGRLFTAARALLFGSHTEYWTTDMRAHLESALAAGANAVFFGANNIYWRPVPVGARHPYRILAIYRLPTFDPYARDPARASVRWRQAPISRPEQSILGEQYGCVGVLMPLTVPRPALGWMFAGSGARPGQVLPGVNYYETDVPNPTVAVPPGTQVVTRQTFACPRRKRAQSGAAITIVPVRGATRGIVIDLGTQGWVCELNASCVTAPEFRSRRWLVPSAPITLGVDRNRHGVRAIIERVTATLLRVVGEGPAGRVAVANPYPRATR